MTYLIPFIIILAAAAFLFLLARKKTPSPESSQPVLDAGAVGERYARDALEPLPGYKRFLSNCYIPKSDGTYTEADLILLHQSGIYVIESKNYNGAIFGSEEDQYWTQSLAGGRRKSSFYNPIRQNKGHIKWLKYNLDLGSDTPCYSVIVFGDGCKLKKLALTSGEHFVVNRRELLETVRKNAKAAGRKLTRKQIDTFYSCLYPLTQVSEEQKALHAETVQQKQKKTAASQPALIPAAPKAVEPPPKQEERICPRCGGKLVVRTAKKGERAGKLLWGCSNWPKCWYTENIEEETASVH